MLRALSREPAAVEAFRAEVALARGADRRLDAAADRVGKAVVEADEASARRLVESLALVLQGPLLVRHAPAAVADAFCASRLAADGEPRSGLALGTLPPGLGTRAVVERATPQPA